jgi:hypothetical protein
MGALVQLASTALAVQPGRTVTTEVTVRNTASVVDRFTFEALGPAGAWVTFAPETLSLFPEASGTVNMVVAPPRSSAVPAGTMAFGVRAVSAEDPEGSVAEEGTLEVAPFSDVSVELLPRVVQGRRAGVARLAVDNRSNVAYDATPTAADPADALRFAFRPPLLSVLPGNAGFVRVRVRPVRVFWRGPKTTKPFQLSLGSEQAPHPPRLDTDGTFVQEALLPKWVMWVIAALIALAVIFTILWFAFLKPQIKSTATDAAKSQLAAAGLSSGSAASPPPTTASGSNSTGSSATQTSTTLGSSSASGGTSTSGGVTVNRSGVASGNGNQVLFTIPAGDTLQITDMLVQNAAGDNGTLSLARGGSVLMQWSMATFRDLDYHWVSPILFSGGSTVVMSVSGCTNPCHPGLYYAGQLVKG